MSDGNCPNCGAVVSIYDRCCPYCGRQNFITIDDIMNKPKRGCYVSVSSIDELNNYRTADGTLHRAISKPHKIITIVEE